MMVCLLARAYAGFSRKLSKAVDQKNQEGQSFISALEENKETQSDWLSSQNSNAQLCAI